MVKRSLFCYLLLLSAGLFSQTNRTGAIIFFKEKNVVIYVDSQKVSSSKILQTIAIGYHKLKAWAPSYQLLEDTFTVSQGKTRFFTRHLIHTDEYKNFRTKENHKKLLVALPVILTSISAIFFTNQYFKKEKEIKDAYNTAQGIERNYNNAFSPNEFEIYKSEYTSQIELYQKLITQQQQIKTHGILVTSSLAAISVSAILWKCLSKKAIFTEKILLSKINPSFNPINKELCLVIKL